MTAAETLAQYQALAGQVTKGPWNLDRFGLIVREGFWDEETDQDVATVVDKEDSLFIAASRALGPAMAAALQEILNLHAPFHHWGEQACSHCIEASWEGPTWPWPTVAIITKRLEEQ